MCSRFVLAAAAPLLCAFTCGHAQQEGPYSYVVDQVIQDPCGLVPPSGQVGTGTLMVIGDQVRVDDFTTVGGTLQLLGSYESQVEAFYMDGSAANVSLIAAGQSCRVDQLQADFRATTDSPTQFHGAMRLHTQVTSQTVCQCDAWISYHAILQ